MVDADRIAVAFARAARGAGLVVPVDATVELGRAFAAVGLGRRTACYWAGHATLVRRPEDRERYDAVFAAFWGAEPGGAAEPGPPAAIARVGLDDPAEAAAAGDQPGGERGIVARWSPTEVLADRDFAAYTAAEHEQARRWIAELRVVAAARRTRRHAPSRRRRGRTDLRRTVRRATRTGGEVTRLVRRARVRRPRRVVLLLDVSGSMEPYARALARFAHAAVVGHGRTEVFAVGTRLTHLTPALAHRDPDVALGAAIARARDWSGGTRLGSGLARFNAEWGARGTARGAIVVVLSDGWDRGSPDTLAAEMARLRRVAHRVVWVNPLKASPGYEPLARGMAAALPHVDEFLEGHSLAALGTLARIVGEPERRGGAGAGRVPAGARRGGRW